MAPIGITILVASIFEVGQAFQESRTPVASYVRFNQPRFVQRKPSGKFQRRNLRDELKITDLDIFLKLTEKCHTQSLLTFSNKVAYACLF
jgi:hypothetical protein